MNKQALLSKPDELDIQPGHPRCPRQPVLKGGNLPEAESKEETFSTGSPQKKKKMEKTKKGKKKSKMKTRTDSLSGNDGSACLCQTFLKTDKEKKSQKEKIKESVKNKGQKSETSERGETTDKPETLEIWTLAGEMPNKSEHVTEFKENSKVLELTPPEAMAQLRKDLYNQVALIQQRKDLYIQEAMTQLGCSSLRPVSCEATEKFPFKSHIPLIVLDSSRTRSKLDKLIQYRRWREAMLDCIHPSRLPLSQSFRKTLDSAVMEEWSLHCWQPSQDVCMDCQGVWWSTSCHQTGEEEEEEGMTQPVLGDGRLLSRDAILDLTARLPYLKVGPLRFIHASYILMAVVCLTLGHWVVRLYHCEGDDYEYYCSDDDLECQIQMLAQNS